jgi:hypothetical protein
MLFMAMGVEAIGRLIRRNASSLDVKEDTTRAALVFVSHVFCFSFVLFFFFLFFFLLWC